MHVHSNHSDGSLTVEEIVDRAVERGLDGIALTDHDTVSGIDEIIRYASDDLIIVPGLEFSCSLGDEEVHILGYFIDYEDEDLISKTKKLKEKRLERGLAIIDKLAQEGIDISREDLSDELEQGFLGRPHIGRVLINKSYVDSMEEAFDKYIGRGCPGFVDRYKLSVEEAVRLIKKSGGIAVLAHPALLKDRDNLAKIIDKGIDGIECFHSKHNNEDVKWFIDLAKKNNLLITGGSDCHGRLIDGELLLSQYYIELDSLDYFRR